MAHDLFLGQTKHNWASGPNPTDEEIVRNQAETMKQLQQRLDSHDTWIDRHPFILPVGAFAIVWAFLNRREKHIF
jgi:hypothetical protein